MLCIFLTMLLLSCTFFFYLLLSFSSCILRYSVTFIYSNFLFFFTLFDFGYLSLTSTFFTFSLNVTHQYILPISLILSLSLISLSPFLPFLFQSSTSLSPVSFSGFSYSVYVSLHQSLLLLSYPLFVSQPCNILPFSFISFTSPLVNSFFFFLFPLPFPYSFFVSPSLLISTVVFFFLYQFLIFYNFFSSLDYRRNEAMKIMNGTTQTNLVLIL